MKTAQLPPVRVAPAVRREIEDSLREGESLSEFVEAAALQAARQRKAQQEFLARGRTSLAAARRTGEFYAATDVIDQMRTRLDKRVNKLSRSHSPSREKA